MKITMLTTDYLPNIGGVAQHIYELARALAVRGDQVEVIAPLLSSRWSSLFKRPWLETGGAFDVWRIPWCSSRTVRFFSGILSWHLSRAKFSADAKALLSGNPPDVLHWHALDARGFPAESFGGHKVWTNHTSNFIEGIKSPRGLEHFQREAAVADHVLCPSGELAELTVGIGVPAERVHFISNGVDAQRFRPSNDGSAWRNRIGVGAGQKLVLCPRRLEKKNGVRYFVQAAIQLINGQGRGDLHFAVAGNFDGHRSDSDEEVVKRDIAQSGTAHRIHLLGRVENAAIPGLYAAADLVVMPSLMEATSLSAMEAMATGKAIVSTNVGGLPFLIRDQENGLLVPPRDPGAIAAGIARLLGNPDLASRMGHAGRKRVVEELDWSKIAEQTSKYYKQ